MDDLQHAFYEASSWDVDNSYPALTATARGETRLWGFKLQLLIQSKALLFFDTPKGVRLHVSSLSSPNFASSYTLGSVGLVDGALSYLYSSLPLMRPSWSSTTSLRHVVQGYRHVRDLQSPAERVSSMVRRVRSDRKGEIEKCNLFL